VVTEDNTTTYYDKDNYKLGSKEENYKGTTYYDKKDYELGSSKISGSEVIKGNKTYYLDGNGNLKGIKKNK